MENDDLASINFQVHLVAAQLDGSLGNLVSNQAPLGVGKAAFKRLRSKVAEAMGFPEWKAIV